MKLLGLLPGEDPLGPSTWGAPGTRALGLEVGEAGQELLALRLEGGPGGPPAPPPSA